MNDDMILPDDFEATPQAEAQGEDTAAEVTEVEEIKPTEETQVQTEIPKIRVKYNHEEKELTLEEATLLAQKGMNYDKTIEKLKNLETDPRLSFVEAQARKYNMTPHEYIEAVKKQEEQEQLRQLIQQNIPEEYAKEILENKRFREQFKAQETAKAKEEAKGKEFADFVNSFPDVKAEDIPTEVWKKQAEGVPLKYAYMEHQYSQLNQRIKVIEQNEANKKKAPVGSVTAHGGVETASEDDFIRGFNSI